MIKLEGKGKKAAALLLTMMLVVFGLAGCGDGQNNNGGGSSAPVGSADPSVSSEEPDTGDEAQAYEVALTYVNAKYMEEGDESLDKLIKDVSGRVEVSKDAEGIDEACQKTVELLQQVPDGRTDLMTSVSSKYKINSVKVGADGAAIVDLAAFSDDTGMDNYTEQFFIYQITGSLIDSFEEVKSVKFTVDGKEVETLGGHLDATTAYTLTDVDLFNASSSTLTADEE